MREKYINVLDQNKNIFCGIAFEAAEQAINDMKTIEGLKKLAKAYSNSDSAVEMQEILKKIFLTLSTV